MRPLALAIAFVALAAASLPAQEPELKIASPKAKDKFKVKVTEWVEYKTVVYLVGEDIKKVEYKKKVLEYEDEITDAKNDSRLPKSLIRHFKVAQIGSGVGTGSDKKEDRDKEKEKVTTEQLQIQSDKPVTISQNGPNSYNYTFRGQPLADARSLDVLKAEFGGGFSAVDLRVHMIPKMLKCKDGEAWKMKPGEPALQAVMKELNKAPNDLMLNETAAEIVGDVSNVKSKKDDKPTTGKLKITLTAPISQFAKDKGYAVEKGELKIVLEGTGCIDGKVCDGDLLTTMTLNIKGTIDGLKMDVDIIASEDRETKFIPPPEPKPKK